MRKTTPKDEGLNWFDSSNPENAGLIYTADGEMLQSFSSGYGLFIKQIW